ncbi:hypothetical protein [Streptomyces sp. NPDC048350]|uniref:hypothetical protein n=1 Tax=Streptomyces sp. NPDC048350 TaxID=3365538 RepID=UPI0037163BDB
MRAGGPAPRPGVGAPDGRRADRAAAGQWLVRGRDGRLTAYAQSAERLLRWTEVRPGGPEWTGPDVFEVPGVSRLTVTQGADGYVHVMGRRSVLGDDGATLVDLVHATQYQSGRPLGPLHSAGSPYRDPERSARLGEPAAVVGASGALWLFVRNAGGGVSARTDGASGGWKSWRDLKGSGVRGDLAPAVDSAGRVELLAPGRSGALHWGRQEAGGEPRRAPDVPVVPAEGSITALETSPDRITYYWADAATGALMAHRPGGWVIPLGGVPSAGRPAALRAPIDGYDCTVLAHRAEDGQIMLAACGSEQEDAGLWWASTGETSPGDPGLALDARGRIVLAVVGADGRLHVSRQKPEQGLAMGRAARF